MTQPLAFAALIENKLTNRMAREDMAIAKLGRRESDAERMVGELSSGKCYVWPVGGKYREGRRADLVAFLIRNNYA